MVCLAQPAADPPVVPDDPLANARDGGAAVAESGSPVADDFWALSGLTRRPVAPLRYQVDATYYINDQTYTATLEFTVSPPDKAYAVVSAADPFPLNMRVIPGVGTEFAVNGSAMMVRNGWTNQRRVAHWDGSDPPPFGDGLSSSRLPLLEPYILGFVHANTDRDATVTADDGPDGTRTVVVAYPHAVKWLEPHAVARLEWTVDTQRHVALSTAAYDDVGKQVATTEYSELTQQADGTWAALRSDTVIRAGEAQAKLGSKERERLVPVPADEVRITTHWQVLPEGMHVPWAKAFEDSQGRLLLELAFTEYEVDPDIPATLFEIEATHDATTGGKEG